MNYPCFHIGSSWGVSEATVYSIVRWVEDYLMRCGQFRLAGKKQLVRGFGKPQVVVMDVTENPIERPKCRQRQFYSGKKKQHTLKCQIVLEWNSGQIICTFFGKGRRHDFKRYQASGVRFAPEIESLQDKGYQGIQKLHSNSLLPHKKPRGKQLTQVQKADNRALQLVAPLLTNLHVFSTACGQPLDYMLTLAWITMSSDTRSKSS